MRTAWLAIFALIVLGGAAAQPDLAPELDEPLEQTQGTAIGLADQLVGTATDLGAGVADAGEAFGAGLARIGDALGTFLRAIGTGAAATLGALTGAGTATAAGIAIGASALTAGIGATTTIVGGGVGTITVIAAGGVAAGAKAIGATVALAAGAYWDLIQPLRPEAMPQPAFVAIAAGSAAATTGIAGWSLWSTLRRLGFTSGLLGLAGFSRIGDHEVLEHPMRARLMDAIRASPGIHASQLARDAEIGWGTVTHHLQKMEKARLVAVRTVNNQRCYFENGGALPRESMALAGALKVETAANIVAYVEHHPMSSQKAVAQALGVSAALVSFHVRKLVGVGALEKIRRGKEMLLAPCQAVRDLATQQGTITTPAVEAAAGVGS